MIDIREVTAERLVAADRRTRIALLGTPLHHDRAALPANPMRRAASCFRNCLRNGCARSTASSIEELAAGRVVRDSQRKLKTLITDLAKQKVQAIVLGCTELVLAVDARANVLPVYDTTAIHARAAVEWMLDEEEEARAAA